jgi:hypothetical protein
VKAKAKAHTKTDWRSFLVDAGYSDQLGHHMSQLVDPAWGGAEWVSKEANAIRRPFVGKKFLFLEPKTKNKAAIMVSVQPAPNRRAWV